MRQRRTFFAPGVRRGGTSKPTLSRHDQVRRSTDRLLIIEDDGRVPVVTLQFGNKLGQAHWLPFWWTRRGWRCLFPTHRQRGANRVLGRDHRRRNRRNCGMRIRRSSRRRRRGVGRICRLRCDSGCHRCLGRCRSRDRTGGRRLFRLQIGEFQLHRALDRDASDTFLLIDPTITARGLVPFFFRSLELPGAGFRSLIFV
jgi:hypothetical protein